MTEYGFDPGQEAPGFDFNVYELKRWRIAEIWGAAQGSPADRARLRASWIADLAVFRKWNTQFWQAQKSNPTLNRRYSGGGSTRLKYLNIREVLRLNPDLAERLERGGAMAIYQHAGCTTAQCEALEMFHGGRGVREIARALGIHFTSVRDRLVLGTAKLEAFGTLQLTVNYLEELYV